MGLLAAPARQELIPWWNLAGVLRQGGSTADAGGVTNLVNGGRPDDRTCASWFVGECRGAAALSELRVCCHVYNVRSAAGLLTTVARTVRVSLERAVC